jgi:hypothetical protein
MMTFVVNLEPGPSVSSAAIAVTIFVVEAGAKPTVGLSWYSTCPVERSATSAPTCGPRSPDLMSPSRLAVTPATVASLPDPADDEPVAPRKTVPGLATPRGEMVGSWNEASLGGRSRATAAPAPIVKRQSRASANAIIRASRFTV